MGFLSSLLNGFNSAVSYAKDEVKMAVYSNSNAKPNYVVPQKSVRDTVSKNMVVDLEKQDRKKSEHDAQVSVDNAVKVSREEIKKQVQETQRKLDTQMIKRQKAERLSREVIQLDGVTAETIRPYYYVENEEFNPVCVLPNNDCDILDVMKKAYDFIEKDRDGASAFFGIGYNETKSFFKIIRELYVAGINVSKLEFNSEYNLFNGLFDQLVETPESLSLLKMKIESIR